MFTTYQLVIRISLAHPAYETLHGPPNSQETTVLGIRVEDSLHQQRFFAEIVGI